MGSKELFGLIPEALPASWWLWDPVVTLGGMYCGPEGWDGVGGMDCLITQKIHKSCILFSLDLESCEG